MTAGATPQSAIVVGAGVVGIGCAHYLAKAGLQVTVIDRQQIAGACSHGNCGYVCPSHVLPLTEPAAIPLAFKSLFDPQAAFRVKPSLDPTFLQWMLQFARRCTRRQMIESGRHLQALLESSMAEYRQLMHDEQLACEWKQDGLLCVYRSKRALDEAIASDRFVEQHFGMAAKVIDGGELTRLDPALQQGLAGALHHTHDASLRPDLLCAEWAERLRQRGVTFVESCSLQEVGKTAGRITHLQTSQGNFEADLVVFAMGAWSPDFQRQLGCKLPVQPGKGYSITMRRPDPCPRFPMLFPEKRVGVSPFEHGYRLGSMMEFVGRDTSIPRGRIDQLRRAAEPYLLTPHTPDEQEVWYGWRPMTWDTVPIIGKVPGLDNGLVATGHSMLGVSMATGTGKLIAELALDLPTHIDATGYSPARFG